MTRSPTAPPLSVAEPGGSRRPLDWQRVRTITEQACSGLGEVDPAPVLEETRKNLYDGMSTAELDEALTLAARTLVERDPEYSRVSARLLLDKLRSEALSYLAGQTRTADEEQIRDLYPSYFAAYVRRGVELEVLDPQLAEFDLDRLGRALRAEPA